MVVTALVIHAWVELPCVMVLLVGDASEASTSGVEGPASPSGQLPWLFL